jgi:hypothetical protein
MPLYLITYDLRKWGRNYSALYEALSRLNAVRLLQSVWLVQLPGPASIIRDIITAELDSNDGVAVIELEPTAQWATYRPEPDGLRWLWAHIPHHD